MDERDMETPLHGTAPDDNGDVQRFILVEENGREVIRVETIVPNAPSLDKDWVRNVAELSMDNFRLGPYNQRAKNALEDILRKRRNAPRT
ncbi:MAG: hypothetical protein WB677_16100 [Xanthobacteraceae bacterium]